MKIKEISPPKVRTKNKTIYKVANMEASTLRELLDQHPEWADLPIAIYRPDGELDFIGGAGRVYKSEDNEGSILVFAPN